MNKPEFEKMVIAIQTAYSTAYLDGFAVGYDTAQANPIFSIEAIEKEAQDAANGYINELQTNLYFEHFKGREN